jgi:hypothetical protein
MNSVDPPHNLRANGADPIIADWYINGYVPELHGIMVQRNHLLQTQSHPYREADNNA